MEDMKAKNYHVYGDAATVQRLKDEYDFIGRYARITEPGHLVVFAYPPKKEKKKRDDRRTGQGSKRQDRN